MIIIVMIDIIGDFMVIIVDVIIIFVVIMFFEVGIV